MFLRHILLLCLVATGYAVDQDAYWNVAAERALWNRRCEQGDLRAILEASRTWHAYFQKTPTAPATPQWSQDDLPGLALDLATYRNVYDAMEPDEFATLRKDMLSIWSAVWTSCADAYDPNYVVPKRILPPAPPPSYKPPVLTAHGLAGVNPEFITDPQERVVYAEALRAYEETRVTSSLQRQLRLRFKALHQERHAQVVAPWFGRAPADPALEQAARALALRLDAISAAARGHP